jgi:TPR repeat protein
MGWLLLSESKFADARAMFEKSKAIGSDVCDDALNVLASKETENLAFEAIESEDYQRAFTLLEPQKGCDSEYTLIALGWLYQTGKGGVTDKHLASSFYRRAVGIGSIEAHYRIGVLELDYGKEEAARAAFFEGSAEEHLPAMSRLGEMMIEGIGGPLDDDQGMKLLLSAAEQGHVMSRVRLIKIETRQTWNIFKKIALEFKLWRVLREGADEVCAYPFSPKMFEYSGLWAVRRLR